MKKIELLAPAGNLAKMATAFLYGADAVYLGIPDFSLRVRINDFDLKSLREAVAYAHKKQKKVYVTVNIFAHNKHLKKLPTYLKILKNLKADALIISDPGILNLTKKYCPRIPIHLSTQANCTNSEAVKFWAKQGVERIILGREVTLTEIKEIKKIVPKIELEYFVHGAMCMAYSGRCFLSKELVDRSANLGDCAQPCRWPYEVTIKAEKRADVFELVEENHGAYLLNSKDLCLVKHLPELIKAGVTSFKIEGRAKSIYYLATIVGIYKAALLETQKVGSGANTNKKSALSKKLNYFSQELKTKIINRGYTSGFLLNDKAAQNTTDSHNKVAWEFCGQVLASAAGLVLVKVHNTILGGSIIEIISPNYDIIRLKLNRLWDYKSQAEIKEAHGGGGGQMIIFELEAKIPAGSVLRRKLL
ncbi:MAG: U32 family peptidase C-terminal domain-containing protein [Candidatus Falkowbacteria bacterium]|nr:U32 family peptidase C-terminal domain-containing protein [Candidatus Falkowbacteria bacterium]